MLVLLIVCCVSFCDVTCFVFNSVVFRVSFGDLRLLLLIMFAMVLNFCVCLVFVSGVLAGLGVGYRFVMVLCLLLVDCLFLFTLRFVFIWFMVGCLAA